MHWGGKNNEELEVRNEELSVMRSFSLFLISIILYYACMAAYKLGPLYCHFQMVSNTIAVSDILLFHVL